MRRRLALVVPVICLIAAPLLNADDSILLAQGPSTPISDAAHQGPPGFYFLPPLASATAHVGIFDGDLSPVIEVCETPECDVIHASFTTAEGAGSEIIRMVAEDEHYIVNWHTGRTGTLDGRTYRIRVLTEGTILGHADVMMVANGREARNVDAEKFIPLIRGSTLPIKVRLETGVEQPELVISPPEEEPVAPAWHAMGGSENKFVHALLVWDHGPEVLYMGGTVETPAWNGRIATWQEEFGGAGWREEWSSGLASEPGTSAVYALSIYDIPYGDGQESLDPAPAAMVAMHNDLGLLRSIAGGPWELLGGFEDLEPLQLGSFADIRALATYRNDLYVAGVAILDEVREDDILRHHARNIARWDGLRMNRLPDDLEGQKGEVYSLPVFALAEYGDQLAVAGEMGVYLWDGADWGPRFESVVGPVRALAIYEGDLIAAGDFTEIGGVTANRIARWNGTSWSAMGAGMDQPVHALTTWDGYLVAGGEFTRAGGAEASLVARWDGSEWTALGAGIDNDGSSQVRALAEFRGDLIAGGRFGAVGWPGDAGADENWRQFEAHNIARWGLPASD